MQGVTQGEGFSDEREEKLKWEEDFELKKKDMEKGGGHELSLEFPLPPRQQELRSSRLDA